LVGVSEHSMIDSREYIEEPVLCGVPDRIDGKPYEDIDEPLKGC
jgi:hypothetical protein